MNGLDAKESTTGAVLINRDAVLLPQPQELTHDKPNSIKKVNIYNAIIVRIL